MRDLCERGGGNASETLWGVTVLGCGDLFVERRGESKLDARRLAIPRQVRGGKGGVYVRVRVRCTSVRQSQRATYREWMRMVSCVRLWMVSCVRLCLTGMRMVSCVRLCLTGMRMVSCVRLCLTGMRMVACVRLCLTG
jgi:hypothetical protein